MFKYFMKSVSSASVSLHGNFMSSMYLFHMYGCTCPNPCQAYNILPSNQPIKRQAKEGATRDPMVTPNPIDMGVERSLRFSVINLLLYKTLLIMLRFAKFKLFGAMASLGIAMVSQSFSTKFESLELQISAGHKICYMWSR